MTAFSFPIIICTKKIIKTIIYIKTKQGLTMTRLFAFLLLTSTFLLAQNVSVVENIALTKKEQGQFFYPRFNSAGDKIIFTSESYKGLWLFDLQTNVISNLTMEEGAGYNPVFTENFITYRVSKSFNGRRFFSIKSKNIIIGDEVIHEENVRDLYPPQQLNVEDVFYIKDKEAYNIPKINSQSKPGDEVINVNIENQKIVLYKRTARTELEPLGKGNYIWASLSPDKQELLFTKAGKGTFISDLNGNIISELGYANYPSWMKNGKWIVCMRDVDDGVRIIGSDLYLISADGSQAINLTNTEDLMEMYPSASLADDEVVYHTQEGQIHKLKLRFN